MVMKSVKLASILFYLNSVFVVFCFVSCGSSPTEASSLLTADIRGGMDKPGLLVRSARAFYPDVGKRRAGAG